MNNQGFAFIAAIIIMILLAVLGVFSVSLLSSDINIAINTERSTQAFFVAEGGLQYYIEELSNQDSSWTSPPTKPSGKSLSPGTFTIATANEQDDTIDVTSTGTVTGIEGESVVRVVTRTITRTSSPGNVPDAFYYASYVRHHANLQNTTNSKVIGSIGAEMNIQHWANWKFYDQETWDPDNPPAPSSDPVGDGLVVENIGDIFPYLGNDGFTAYRDNVATSVITGNYTFSAGGTYTGYYYITGVTTVEDNVTINGGIIARGSVNMRHADGITINPGSGMPAIITDNNIDMSNAEGVSVTGHGLIYAEQGLNLQLAENCSLRGTILVDQNMNIKNADNITLEFDPDIIINPPPYFPADFAVGEWDETY